MVAVRPCVLWGEEEKEEGMGACTAIALDCSRLTCRSRSFEMQNSSNHQYFGRLTFLCNAQRVPIPTFLLFLPFHHNRPSASIKCIASVLREATITLLLQFDSIFFYYSDACASLVLVFRMAQVRSSRRRRRHCFIVFSSSASAWAGGR